jgi:predicted DNA-binding transcriptional regulator YafY
MAEEKKQAQHGKKNDQKMKPYLVYEYLMRYSDANHVVSANELVGYLQECGISAERRSIYKDIEEINKALLLTQRDGYGIPRAETVEEAEELLQDDKEKTIIYDSHRKGFYVRKRHYKVDDIRLLAECVYSAKFIDEKRAKRLANVVCDLVSEHHAEDIKRDAFLVDRVKTDNTEIYEIVSKINAAMSRKRNKKAHVPEKIRFKYLKYTIQNGVKRVERRRGEWYIVSPYKLLISDGFYYLMGYDEKMKKILNYRIDRITDVELIGEARSGEEEFKAVDMESYLKEHFSMYHGTKEHITLRAVNTLLDTFVDRFGTRNVIYTTDDERHFTARVSVSVSEQFYGWLCGLGSKVKIVSPENVRDDFKAYLFKIQRLYD